MKNLIKGLLGLSVLLSCSGQMFAANAVGSTYFPSLSRRIDRTTAWNAQPEELKVETRKWRTLEKEIKDKFLPTTTRYLKNRLSRLQEESELKSILEQQKEIVRIWELNINFMQRQARLGGTADMSDNCSMAILIHQAQGDIQKMKALCDGLKALEIGDVEQKEDASDSAYVMGMQMIAYGERRRDVMQKIVDIEKEKSAH